MPWLSNTECLQYSPGITLTGEALTTAISLAQVLAEGINGSNRKLEIASYSRVIKLPRNGRVKFPLLPVVQSVSPVIKIRGTDLPPRFGVYSTQEWEALTINTDYLIDYDNNEVVLLGLSRLLKQEYIHSGFRRYQKTPTSPHAKKQIKITFSSGLNFSQTTEEVLTLKRALASIVAIRTSPQSQGVKKIDVSDDQYSVTYASQSDYIGITKDVGVGSPINELLSIFRIYRPTEVST